MTINNKLNSLGCMVLVSLLALPCLAQDDPDRITIDRDRASDANGVIIVDARGKLPDPPLFYTAHCDSSVQAGLQSVEQTIQLTVKVIQGKAKTLSFGLHGDGDVMHVQADNIQSWSVRQQADKRFLDLNVDEDISELKAQITILTRRSELPLPTEINLAHLAPGDAVGFDSIMRIEYAAGVEGKVTLANGFVPLESSDAATRFQTSTGGEITIFLSREGGAPQPVELVNPSLDGDVHADGKSVLFRFRSTAVVTKADAEIEVLSGPIAILDSTNDDAYRFRLVTADQRSVYKLVFDEPGEYPVSIDFVASLVHSGNDGNESIGRGIDFTVAAGAIVPITLNGLGSELDFRRDQDSVVPIRRDDQWLGFLPASGRARLQWRSARKAGEGKLFFTTTGRVEAKVGTGLLKQDHQINYQVLQGELKSLTMLLKGPGEILDVQGNNIVAWKVSGKDEDRQLDVTLSQPITSESQINVRTQTPLGAFPVRVEGLRMIPLGAIRHSGFLRVTNRGLVRLEPTGLSGISQLAPEQFPGEPIEARQVFVYRFPAAEYAYSIAVDRIEPEVNVSELVLYQLSDTDRAIRADIELDIREAPIREWDFLIPADYSVVSVTGASVADYIVASEVADEHRNLKVIFGQDIAGRQLVSFHLEKSESASEEDWVLPRIEYIGAKSVRGDIGILSTPGFRIAIVDTDLLVEKPLSYFPKPSPQLQQAFRIREPGWSATMHIELLDRSIASDVFHLYSLSEETVFGSSLINYFVTGSPVSEWKIAVPAELGNVMVDGQDVRTWRREGDNLIVSLHQPVIGAYTLLVTYEEKPDKNKGTFRAGQVMPLDVQGERGYIQVVSPTQVAIDTLSVSDWILQLDALELPAEFRLLSTAPALGTWQYTERPFDLNLQVNWFEPGTTVNQVVEFAEANSRVSKDGELVTDVLYYVKSRGQRTLKIKLPPSPVRLWEVTVDGQPVTARQSDDTTLIPLIGGTDPNIPVEVRLRLGKPTVNESHPELMLPVVDAPVLKTQWNVTGDEKHVLVPSGGTVAPSTPVLRPSGFAWIAKRGSVSLMLISLLSGLAVLGWRRAPSLRLLSLISLAIAIVIACSTASSALNEMEPPSPLELSIPILSAGETIALQVTNTPLWRVNFSWTGLTFLLIGIVGVAWSFITDKWMTGHFVRSGGMFLIAMAALLQGDGAPLFFAMLAIAILGMLFVPMAWKWMSGLPSWYRSLEVQSPQKKDVVKETVKDAPSAGAGPITTAILFSALALSAAGSTLAGESDGIVPADSIKQVWSVTHQDSRLVATGTIKVSGTPGDQFLLLKPPAVLTRFAGDGLRLTKIEVAEQGLMYVISIAPTAESFTNANENANTQDGTKITAEVEEYEAEFEYQLEAIQPMDGMPVLTGSAAIQEIKFAYDEAGWDVFSSSAVRIESSAVDGATQARVLLGPGPASLYLKAKARDVATEDTQFFVEASNLYLPGPGVVDGVHRIHVRPSQGRVGELTVVVPQGLTVSSVSGPIGSWQFDADSGRLRLEVEPQQSQAFEFRIETQRGLDPLPVDVTLAPVKVEGAIGEVGLLGIAFGPDAQPEKLESKGMSTVNLGDFDPSLLPNNQAVLHRAFRYGAEGGELVARIMAVESEVRIISKQVLSLGDERVVLGVQWIAEISRAGLFQLSFSLPNGLEVESLSGPSLHHWAEVSEDGQRQIILHLNGKTIGTQSFAMTLSGSSPTDAGDWEIPRFELNEATRQTGELVVRPTTGIRLRTVSRQNVSESDSRSLGGETQGSLAFRLLQRDWNLVLGIEKLDPWVTGQVLHEVILREGQTRSTLLANFDVQNASIRSLRVTLPINDPDEIKTLRASGDTVSDLLPVANDSNLYEVQFKRRVIGKVDFRIEFERRGDRENEQETLVPAEFPEARQVSYYFGVRAGGRLELEHSELSAGWQRIDWSSVPSVLRESENRNAPAIALRATNPDDGLVVHAKRHSLADALKLRVAKGSLTTVLSPTGDQLTSVDVNIEVIQRSSLSVVLPKGGELFSIFVNGESVNSIRQDGDVNAWEFYILPGIDDRTATVRFVYSLTGERLKSLKLSSPLLNVPLENIEWNVVAPTGFELTDNDGNLELIRRSSEKQYDRTSYLSKVSGKREVQAQQAAQLLEQANQFLQEGEQTKARWALNSVANRYALDAASNEDARVQLENLQTQQAIVGLNTRRQRLYIDNNRNDAASIDNRQLLEAAADNPILKEDQMNFRPQQLSQLLRGNTTEDNAVLQQIAGRIVEHQHTTEPAPQAIIISLPEEGSVYTFRRSVQVTENESLELDLDFALQQRLHFWQSLFALLMIAALAAIFALSAGEPDPTIESNARQE